MKKRKEPQYVKSYLNEDVTNYHVYYLPVKWKWLIRIVAFLVAAFIGYIFYGGMFTDAYGYATQKTVISNTIVMVLFGVIGALLIVPMVEKNVLEKRKRQLRMQFRDLVDSLVSSINSSSTTAQAFQDARRDLAFQYSDSDFIIQELDIINHGVDNNVRLEDLLEDFATRSGDSDIKSFSNVFAISNEKGGDIREILNKTRTIINDKIIIQEEIETVVAAPKMWQNFMLIAPVALTALIKYSSTDFKNSFATEAGFAATTGAIAIFIASYFLGKKIMNVKL